MHGCNTQENVHCSQPYLDPIQDPLHAISDKVHIFFRALSPLQPSEINRSIYFGTAIRFGEHRSRSCIQSHRLAAGSFPIVSSSSIIISQVISHSLTLLRSLKRNVPSPPFALSSLHFSVSSPPFSPFHLRFLFPYLRLLSYI